MPVERAGLRRRGGGHRRRAAAPAGRAAAGDAGAAARRRVAVVFPDLTRPMPNRTVLPPAARRAGALPGCPTTASRCCAPPGRTGRPPRRRWRSWSAPTSWPATPSSTTTRRATRTCASARSTGRPCCSQREYVEADVRIVTGFVEPHFFAGFSGGPKGGVPGPGRHRDHPGGAPSPPHRRRPGHLRHPRRQPGARLRPRRHRPGAARTCRSTSPSTGPAG